MVIAVVVGCSFGLLSRTFLGILSAQFFEERPFVPSRRRLQPFADTLLTRTSSPKRLPVRPFLSATQPVPAPPKRKSSIFKPQKFIPFVVVKMVNDAACPRYTLTLTFRLCRFVNICSIQLSFSF